MTLLRKIVPLEHEVDRGGRGAREWWIGDFSKGQPKSRCFGTGVNMGTVRANDVAVVMYMDWTQAWIWVYLGICQQKNLPSRAGKRCPVRVVFSRVLRHSIGY